MVGGNFIIKMDKMKDGKLLNINSYGLCDVDAELFSTVTARYYKGICSHKDNMVLEIRELE